ncbi:MAG: hypothetical protein ACT443_06560 [Gemmatimonadota bacterium]
MKYVAVVLLLCVTSTACKGQGVNPALAAAVDSMLPKLEVLAGLKKREPIALAEQSREELRSHVEERLDEELPPEELEGIRRTYVAFGLIPDTLDVRTLLLDLYQEQVAGYYDPESEKFYVMEGTPAGMLRPVLAHELVHALQDQHVDLDSLIARERGNDRQTAAQAAIEGHATLVMFALLAQEAAGRAIAPGELPDISAQLAPALDAQNSQFPVFRRAPRIIRETMVFPYVGGAAFVQTLWTAHEDNGFVAPLGPLLPQSTEQVLHASEKFVITRDVPTELRFTNEQDVVYENTLGELETGILLEEHIGSGVAAVGWDGDRYRLLDNGMLVWQSVWDDAASADRFAEAYREVSANRRNRAIRVERNRVSEREGVLVFDAPAGVDVSRLTLPAVRVHTVDTSGKP